MQPVRTQPPRTQGAGGRVRWLARRPPETLPVPRRAPSGPRPVPRYRATPRWGLHQDFTPPAPVQPTLAETAGGVLPSALRGAALILLLAGLAEAFAYLLLVINRSRPVSVYLALVADVSVFALGWLAVLTVVGVAVLLTLWLLASREHAYAALGTREPRPRWQVWAYCLVPVVNLVAAPVLVLELVRARARADTRAAETTRKSREVFIRRWWAAWVALTTVTVGCVAYSMADGGLQHRADAMAYTALGYLAGAAFLVVTLRLVGRIDAGPLGSESAEETRWLAT